MSCPADDLPRTLSHAVINGLLAWLNLPKASLIVSAAVAAYYHAIYRIKLPGPGARLPSGDYTNDVVLRVSGQHLPTIKTRNEVGVMSWLAQNTSILIPALIAYDDTTANPLQHEYMLLSYVPGLTVSEQYSSMTDKQLEGVVNQVIDILLELQKHEWPAIGGLTGLRAGDIRVSQVVDECFWKTADIEKYWTLDQTVASLNIGGPFTSYVDLITAQVQKNIELINVHPDLALLRGETHKYEAFLGAIASQAIVLNNTKLQLAHRDLHFANMLYDPTSKRLTAVLDWEFAAVVPAQLWDARHVFLLNGYEPAAARKEQQRMLELFTRLCHDRGVSLLEDAKFSSPLQESMQRMTDCLRSVTEAVPRGQHQELVPEWLAEIEKSMAAFGI